MHLPEHIFRSYDIRGKLNEVTPEIARIVAESVVSAKGMKKVVIGRDMRDTSPALMAASTIGATAQGADVVDIGMCTTSMWNYALSHLPGVDAGIMITASHNPAEYNGIKVTESSGDPIAGEELLEIARRGVSASGKVGEVTEQNVLEDYLKKCLDVPSMPDLSGTKVVVDYGNGMGAMSVQPLLDALGVEHVDLYPEPDARFPNHESNPAEEKNVEDLKKAVVAEAADFGIAVDGDMDRWKIVDNRGETVSTDISLALLAQAMLKEAPGSAVAVTVSMSQVVHEAVREAGGSIVVCPVGRTNIVSKASGADAILGGEFSGHVVFKSFHYLEAIDHAIVRFLALWKQSGKTVAELAREWRARYANSGEVNLEVEEKDAVIRALEKEYGPKATEVEKMDGVKCIFGDEWWFIIRKSNTEPIVRLTVEARSPGMMKEKRDEIVSRIKSLI